MSELKKLAETALETGHRMRTVWAKGTKNPWCIAWDKAVAELKAALAAQPKVTEEQIQIDFEKWYESQPCAGSRYEAAAAAWHASTHALLAAQPAPVASQTQATTHAGVRWPAEPAPTPTLEQVIGREDVIGVCGKHSVQFCDQEDCYICAKRNPAPAIAGRRGSRNGQPRA